MTQWAILWGITASVQTLSYVPHDNSVPDFNAKLGRQYIFKPTNGNDSSHNDSNDKGVKVVKHNSQLLKVTVVRQIFHFCLSHWTNIPTLKTPSTHATMTLHKTFTYYHQYLMVRKVSQNKYQKEMRNASVLLITAILLWLRWTVMYLCWQQFCQQNYICNKWVSVWRLDSKRERQCSESYTQNHTNMSHNIPALSQHLLKVK